MKMRAVTIRNVPEEVHRAIRVRAAKNGRTLQAEMCDILTTCVKPEGRVKLGDLLASIGRKVKLTDEEMMVFDRDHSPARAASFE
jgi:plasmid stability protein